jgi:hypothetical protein
LVLAQELARDWQYADNYQRGLSAVAQDDYVILDNGAYEGDPVTNKYLFNAALNIDANEIVLPDVMRDPEGTVEKARAALTAYDQWRLDLLTVPRVHVRDHRFMAVLQSSGSMGEVHDMFNVLADIPQITTIGIPRHFVDFDKYFRWQVLSNVNLTEYRSRFAFHLLGQNPKFPDEAFVIAGDFPWVRSVDSSMPYNYTLAGAKLDPWTRCERPARYFDKDWMQQVDLNLLTENVNTYMRWASGPQGARS